LLFHYSQETKLYKCPADRYLSPAQAAAGFAQRVRSVSMNIFVKGSAIPGEYWLPGFAAYARESDFSAPSPSELWVFADENPETPQHCPDANLLEGSARYSSTGTTRLSMM